MYDHSTCSDVNMNQLGGMLKIVQMSKDAGIEISYLHAIKTLVSNFFFCLSG